MAPGENAYPRKVHPLFNFLNESFGSVSEDRQLVSRNMDPEIDLPNTQDLPCTLNWAYMVPNSGYLGPNRG